MQSEPAGQEGRGRALAFCLTSLPALPRSEVGQGSRGLEELQRAQSRALTVHTLSTLFRSAEQVLGPLALTQADGVQVSVTPLHPEETCPFLG